MRHLDLTTGQLLVWVGLYFGLIWPGDTPWLKSLALLGLLAVFLWAMRQRPRSVFLSPLITPFLLLYLLFSLIAFLISPLPAMSLPRLLYVAGGFFGFAAVANWLHDAARLKPFMGNIALVGGGIALVGLFTVQWPERQVFDLRPLTNAIPHLSGPYSLNQNAIAGVLLLFLPLAWSVARKWDYDGGRMTNDGEGLFGLRPFIFRRYVFSRWSGWSAAALILFLLFLTQSRNAWLALPIMAAAYWGWGRFRFRWLAVPLLLFILLPFTLSWWPDIVWQQSLQPVTTLDTLTKTGQPPPQSWLSRLEIWSVAGQAIQDYPVWGTGLFTFVPISRANYLFTVIPPDFDFTHAHNLFLQTALNQGLVGALVLAGLWVTVLWGLWRPRMGITTNGGNTDRRSIEGGRDSPTPWAAVIGTTFIGYLWFNLFDMISLEQRQGIFVWLLLAAANRLMPTPTRPPGKGEIKWVWLPLVFMTLLSLTPAAARNWHFLRLDQSRFIGQPLAELPQAAAADARRTGLVYWTQGDEAAALAAWQQDAQAVPFLRQQGSVALIEADPAAAIRWYDLALRLDNTDGTTYFWRGVAQRERGDEVAAQHDFQQAIHYLAAEEPASRFLQAKAWEQLGRIWARREAWTDAAAAFTHALTLFPDDPDYQQQLNEIKQALAEQAAQE